MKACERDQTPVYFARTVGKTEERDAFGNPTGRFRPVYDRPRLVRVNLSGKQGTVEKEKSGLRVRAKRFAVTCDPALPVDENTVFWIDRVPFPRPEEETAEPVPPDYLTDNVKKTKNSATYTLLEVRTE